MRVLHTSDWHLGIASDGSSRRDDHARFLSWLRELIGERGIDVLLVAGDIFDTVSPSADTQRQLYAFLGSLRDTGLRRAIFVGGNHDSAAQLDAPRALLSTMNIDVVGSYRGDDPARRHLVAITGESKDVELVVAAVPFVHEFRLGIRTTDDTRDVVHQRLVQRFREVYGDLAEHASTRYGHTPLIAMGHLTCGAASRDDYPHEVHQVGTLGSLPADVFDSRYRYVALGHLHQRRRVEGERVRYCGTPIALTLREASSARYVLMFDSDESEPNVTAIEVPQHRDMIEMEGSLKDVCAQLRSLTWSTSLRPIVHVRLAVDRYDPTATAKIYDLVHECFGRDAPPIAELRQVRRDASERPTATTPTTTRLRDLEPEDVFRRLCAVQQVEADDDLLAAFRSLLTETPPDDAPALESDDAMPQASIEPA